MDYGYLRVSSNDQNVARQFDELRALGIPKKRMYMDKCSGKDFQRPQYQQLIQRLGPGDRLIVKSIDRLGRNYQEILEQWKYIVKELGADIQVLDMPLLDTSCKRDLVGTLISDIVLQLLSFVAENERTNIRQRQAEGIASAKLRGIHLGRPALPNSDAFPHALAQFSMGGLTVTQAADAANMSRSTFYRHAQAALLAAQAAKQQPENAAERIKQNACAPKRDAGRGSKGN